MDTSIARPVRLMLVGLLLVGLALLTAQLADVLLLIFAAILLATLITAAAQPFVRIGIRQSWSVLLGLATLFAILGLLGWLFGATLGAQFEAVANKLPGAIAQVQAWANQVPLLQSTLSATPDLQGMVGRALSVAFGALGAVLNIVLVVIGAVYLALQPRLYAKGLARLFPKSQTAQIDNALTASGSALRRYLLAQFVTMAAVGSIVGVGLTIVGVPSAAALGVIVGLANFVPLIGPFIGAIPGLLIAFGQGTDVFIWAVVVYFIAQQLEGNILTPLVQRYAVSIPPALLLFALAGVGSLFGIIGVIVAAPLAVVLYTLVSILWVRDTLGHVAASETD